MTWGVTIYKQIKMIKPKNGENAFYRIKTVATCILENGGKLSLLIPSP